MNSAFIQSKFNLDKSKHWLGFDLDGVLAIYNKGQYPKIGEPNIHWCMAFKQLRREGWECRIVTARVGWVVSAGDKSSNKHSHNIGINDQVTFIRKWVEINLGEDIVIQAHKDPWMGLLFDDRAIYCDRNGDTTSPELNWEKSEMPEIQTVPELLRRAANTYEERHHIYGDNYKNYGALMKAFYPEGLKLDTEQDWIQLGLIHNCTTKLARYCGTKSKGHQDSAHDLCVYASMLEEVTKP